MAQPQNALLIPSPVRPNDLLDTYPTAFAIDIKGGLHSVETISDMESISDSRREWGMLCVVYNNTADPTRNGIYQLTYGKFNTDITEDQNWTRLSINTQNVSSGEWVSSVSTLIDTPPGTTPSNGTRFLVATPSFSGFNGQGDKIAEYDVSANGGLGGYLYSTPLNGTTLRIDDQNNLIYKFAGTWGSGGIWYKEYLNQVRYISPTSSNGTTYTFTTTGITPLDAYSYSVYFANFGATNTGASTLQIDGLDTYSIKKSTGSTLTDLASSDIVPNLRYQLIWNDGNFLINNFGGGASSGVIGPAEDGTYSDGLYTDFNPSTPIGVPIDRFNEILKALVPPPAPDLGNWTLVNNFVDGKLSFDSTNAQVNGLSAAPGFSIGSTFNASGTRKGVNSYYSQPKTGATYYLDYTGILNSTVAAPASGAYTAQAFGNGITGSLVLKLNGTTVSNVDIGSTFSSIDQTSGGASTGIFVSAATASKFPNGTPFESFWFRTGNYRVKANDARLRPGFNYLDLSHILPSSTITLASYSWVSDSGTFSTNFTQTIPSYTVNQSQTKALSGIKFWNAVSLTYRVIYANHVKNTFSPSTSALTVSMPPVGGLNKIGFTTDTTTPYLVLPAGRGITSSGPNSTQQEDYTMSLSTNVRRIGESMQFSTSVVRTVQGSDDSTAILDNNWMIDNYPQASNDLLEQFEDEAYRILNLSSKYSTTYNTTGNVLNLTNKWSGTFSLFDGGANYTNGLQVIGGRLIYPSYTFSSIGDANHNPNFGNNGANYFFCNQLTIGHGTTDAISNTSNRTYTRWFRLPSTTNFAKIRFNITHTGTTFVSPNVTLSGQNCWVEVKLPYAGGAQPESGLIGGAVTGWLDMTKPFVNGNWTNGSGAYTNAVTPPVISGQNWEIDFGQGYGTIYSSGYVLFRLTAPSSWTGAILSIGLTSI